MSKGVKHPCKICGGSVSLKNGIKCEGICNNWVHFSCLNYTPGKIKDIKSGIIKVTCPCPNCSTVEPREYRTDKVPFTCNSSQCPARRKPKCANRTCPVNEGKPAPVFETPCGLGSCGSGCKQQSIAQFPNSPKPYIQKACMDNPSSPELPSSPFQRSSIAVAFPKSLQPEPYPTVTYSYSKPPAPQCRLDKSASADKIITGDDLQYRNKESKYNSKSLLRYNAIQDQSENNCSKMEDLCNTIGLLTRQINEMMNKMQSLQNDRPEKNTSTCDYQETADTGIYSTSGTTELMTIYDTTRETGGEGIHKDSKLCLQPCTCEGNETN